jgi:hypothetical protein
VAPGEEDVSEFEDLGFDWGDEEVPVSEPAPVFESELEGIYELDSADELPEDIRESVEEAVSDEEEPAEQGEQDILVP